MSQKLLLAIVFGVLAIVGGYFYLNQVDQTNPSPVHDVDTAKIQPASQTSFDGSESCEEVRRRGGYRPDKFIFSQGEKYGDFILDHVYDEGCVIVYKFVGTTTVAGTYGRSEIVDYYFDVSEADVHKMPDRERSWSAKSIDSLLGKNLEHYEDIKTATLIIANPVMHQWFRPTDAYDTFKIVEVVSTE